MVKESKWKKTGRPTKKAEIGAAKLLRCLQLIDFLKTAHRSVVEVASRFDISTRTVYRYIHLFEEVGLNIEQDFDNNFFIANDLLP